MEGLRFKGIYVFGQWVCRHPYSVQTWSLADWRGFLQGLSLLGYNLVQIWPMIDTMPVPPTPSDKAHLQKLKQVIRIAHGFGFTVVIGAGANITASPKAARYPFAQRPYFEAEELVDPSDPSAVARLMQRRKQLLQPLAEADGFWILDCDPGGYPGSTSQHFLRLLIEHRRLLDSLRPNIQLVYWMWAGWQKRSFEESWQNAAQDAWREVIRGLLREAPEPWRVNACWTGHFQTLQEYNQLHRALYFPYNALEFEPSFPLTNWYPKPQDELPSALSRFPAHYHPLGIMANAQSHCLQLPHLYLFSHLAERRSLDSLDLQGFASRLLPQIASPLHQAWSVLNSQQPQAIREAKNSLLAALPAHLKTADLRGLLFGNPSRFVDDLIFQLDLMADLAALKNLSPQHPHTPTALKALYHSFLSWQKRHGFSDWAIGPFISSLQNTLQPFIPHISSIPFDPRHGYTLRILHTLKNAARI